WPQSFVGDLTTMQAQAVALALLSLAWVAVRLAFRRFGRRFGQRFGMTEEAAEAKMRNNESEATRQVFNPNIAAKLLYPGWPGVDRIITLLLLVFLVGLSLYGVHVGMVEGLQLWPALFSTESRNLATTAFGAGSWLLLLALSLVFVAGLWERFE